MPGSLKLTGIFWPSMGFHGIRLCEHTANSPLPVSPKHTTLMKTTHLHTLLGVAVSVIGLDQTAHAQFNTLQKFGNADNTAPAASYSINAGTISITGGGTDFWGVPDNGTFLWNSTGTQTTSGDFTASVRHVKTTNPAPEWGRDGIMARATQTPGVLSGNDAYWMTCRKSNGQLIINRRAAVGGLTYRATDIGNAAINLESDENDQAMATGDVSTAPIFLSAGRSADQLYSGYAMDLGNGVAGRWIEKWTTDIPAAVSGLQGGAQVIVGLAHQSHTQTISPDENDINTATFDNWSYSGTFNQDRFGGAASANSWQIAGTVQGIASTGAVTGSAFVTEGGAATGEPVKWTVEVYPLSSFVPKFGTSGTRKDPTAMNDTLLVPEANFRHEINGGGTAPGLTADIYLNPGSDPLERAKSGNAGNLAANLALMTAPGITKTSTVIPNVFWSSNNYPRNIEGENLFAKAYGGATFFNAAEDNYGVEMKGQIFIPGDAARKQPNLPGKFVIFKDGNDDFTYLEIDGKPLINDNDWTGTSSTDNNGGNVSIFDASDPKFADGEWVSFRMIMWEGAGGDNAALYWGVSDGADGADPVFTQESVPGTYGNLVPKLGVDNSRKDPQAMLTEDLVPASDFRHPVEGGGTAPGLKADIYLGPDPGNIDAVNSLIDAGNVASSVILPNINWFNSAGQVNYPSSGAGTNIFGDAQATLEIDATTGSDANGYSNYGVNMTGEIFIPGKGQRAVLPVTGGDNLVLFKDGVDDFTYVEIDGQVLIRDNDWTGYNGAGASNGGGQVSLMDVSNPKFDDGEWVPFRMTTWEGGGGDSGALYWSARDTNGTFGISSVPGSSAPIYQATGTAQVGSESAEASFGNLTLPAGDWLLVLNLANTGTTLQRLSTVNVTASPGGGSLDIRSFSYTPAGTTLNLSFASEAGSRYALEYTIGFQAAGSPASAQKWTVVSTHSNITGLAGTTAIAPLNVSTLLAPGGLLTDPNKCFFRIRKL